MATSTVKVKVNKKTVTAPKPVSLLGLIRADAEYKKFKLIVERTQGKLKIQEDLNEAFALHTSRLSPQMYDKKQFSGKSLLEAHAKDLAARSRMERIRTNATLNLSYLHEAEKAMSNYVLDKYKDDMSEFSNAEMRKAFLGRLLRVSYSISSEGQTMLDILDKLIKDIDQAGFNLKGMLGALELITNAKGSVL